MSGVARSAVADRKANAAEVVAHASAIREFAKIEGLGAPRLRDDGTVVVHSDEDGYLAVNRLSRQATLIVGTYVHVITDDAPGAKDTRPL
jgi:hypothetical protein